MLFFARPSVREISSERIVVRIPLRRRTKNHWGTMYFGALGVGADCAVGLLAMHLIKQQSISLIFKDFHAEFHQRADGDVDFICAQGKEIAQLIAQAASTGERVEMPVSAIAIVPEKSDVPVATFKLTLSLKRQS
ncbi:MAG: DUF4442 domain-containing protein [Gallionella sp.]